MLSFDYEARKMRLQVSGDFPITAKPTNQTDNGHGHWS